MVSGSPALQSTVYPSVALVIGGAMWGLFWLPLRAIADSGLHGAWPGAMLYAALAVIVAVILTFRKQGLGTDNWRGLIWSGLFTGSAFTLYSISLLMTDVVRSILLFYVTPVWSTALGLLFLNERLTISRIVALVLGFSGLCTILGLGVQIPWPHNIGDWCALVSGMAWAYGSFCMFRLGEINVFSHISVFVFGSLVVSAVAIVVGGPQIGGMVQQAQLIAALPAVVTAALFVLPMLFLTLWPTSILSPGRVGILLMSEVLVGVASAAWLSGEPFGTREAIGALLIAGAGVVEVLGSRQSNPA